jgi:hypothetical protein
MKTSFVQKIKLLAAAIAAHFATKPDRVPAHCANIKALLLHLCDFDEQRCNWVLKWLAYPLRNPGAKMDMGLIVNGDAGTGKNLFFERIVVHLYEGYAGMIGPQLLHARFNDWAAWARLIVVDGQLAKRHVARAKEYMTSNSIIVERRYEKPRERANHINFVFVSSDANFVPPDVADRRFFVVEAPPPMPRVFYEAVEYEIANGGIEAFREYLMGCLDMSGFDNHTKPPAAAVTRKAKEAA